MTRQAAGHRPGSFLHWRDAAGALIVVAMIAGDTLEAPRRMIFGAKR